MTDPELDSILNTWKAPEAPASMRTQLRAEFRAKPPLKILGVRPRYFVFSAAIAALALGARWFKRSLAARPRV